MALTIKDAENLKLYYNSLNTVPISSNEYLSIEEMTINAQYLFDKFLSLGWTANAICGMLGNMQTESTINPGLWENRESGNMSRGFGLVQWTPASKFTNWADSNSYEWGNIDGQVQRIIYEKDNNLQWIATTSYNYSFNEFSTSEESPYNLALAFLANYERPANPNQPIRGTQAEYWYQQLTPTPQPTTKRKMPLWMYIKKF